MLRMFLTYVFLLFWAPLGISNEALIEKINSYLNGLTCLFSEFDQKTSSQSHSKKQQIEMLRGTLWLRRLEKKNQHMRIDFSTPHGKVLFSDQKQLSIYDLVEKNVDTYGIDQTPAAFILKNRINIQKDFTVQSIEKLDNVLTVKLRADQGDLTLFFECWPTGDIRFMSGWDVIDAQGTQIAIRFVHDTLRIDDPKTVPLTIFDQLPFQELVKSCKK